MDLSFRSLSIWIFSNGICLQTCNQYSHLVNRPFDGFLPFKYLTCLLFESSLHFILYVGATEENEDGMEEEDEEAEEEEEEDEDDDDGDEDDDEGKITAVIWIMDMSGIQMIFLIKCWYS